MNTYTVEYRLDDIEDYDNTEYIDGLESAKEVNEEVDKIKKEYGERIVLLDVKMYDEDGWLVGAHTII